MRIIFCLTEGPVEFVEKICYLGCTIATDDGAYIDADCRLSIGSFREKVGSVIEFANFQAHETATIQCLCEVRIDLRKRNMSSL